MREAEMPSKKLDSVKILESALPREENMPASSEMTIVELTELKAQIDAISIKINHIIGFNMTAAKRSRLDAAIASKMPNSTGFISISQHARQLLVIAGDDGVTVQEMVHILSKTRETNAHAVRTALHRMRDAGRARNVGRRWYSNS